MNELLQILNNNNVKYTISDYAGNESIVIKKNKYKIEIYKDEDGYVSDLQELPYKWGRMGITTLDDIIEDLRKYLKINITESQLSMF